MTSITFTPVLFAAKQKAGTNTAPSPVQLRNLLKTAKVVRFPNLSNQQPQLDILTGIPVVTVPQTSPQQPLVKYLYLSDGSVLKEDYGTNPDSWTRPGQETFAPKGTVPRQYLLNAWQRCDKPVPQSLRGQDS